MASKKFTNLRKEVMIKQVIKKEDPVELPMNEQFYKSMHDNIMAAVENIEIKKQPKWSKNWIFLERRWQAQK